MNRYPSLALLTVMLAFTYSPVIKLVFGVLILSETVVNGFLKKLIEPINSMYLLASFRSK